MTARRPTHPVFWESCSRNCLRAALLWLAAAVVSGGASGQTLEAVYTSTRNVTSIAVGRNFEVVVGTRGGVLVCTDGKWRKFTILDGLLTNEVLGVAISDGRPTAFSAVGSCGLIDGHWSPDPSAGPAAPLLTGQLCACRSNGSDCAATAEGLRVRSGDGWKPIPFPHSTGTHISALLDRGETLWAAVYGDGVFAWDGNSWSPVKLDLPDRARAITAMASDGDRLWLGTTADGVWELEKGKWTPHPQPDEPRDHNCQAISSYAGKLHFSTLDRGLATYSADGWEAVHAPEISGDTPRQMAEFGGSLYVRISTGPVDRFDGKSWAGNVFPDLPRKQCSTLASDKRALYVGQWGGWSEFDGKKWIHHLNTPELRGSQVTAILPDGDTLWIGTQGAGIARFDRPTGGITLYNELSGLPDDTIKCLARGADTLYAGAFSQGLCFLTLPSPRAPSPCPQSESLGAVQVTDLALDPSGGLYIGARTSLWRLDSEKRMKLVMAGIEVQALRVIGNELWVGTRTGVLKLGRP